MNDSPVYPQISWDTVHPKTGRRIFHPAQINKRRLAQVGDKIVVASTRAGISRKESGGIHGGYKMFVLADKPTTRIDLPKGTIIKFAQRVSFMGNYELGGGVKSPGGTCSAGLYTISLYTEKHGYAMRLVEKYAINGLRLSYTHPGQVATVYSIPSSV